MLGFHVTPNRTFRFAVASHVNRQVFLNSCRIKDSPNLSGGKVHVTDGYVSRFDTTCVLCNRERLLTFDGKFTLT